jgi:hypothetical protein
MAGDWLKMRSALWDDPRVVRLQTLLTAAGAIPRRAARATVCGALFRIWSIGDAHSVDGLLPGYDAAAVDEAVMIRGFAEALAAVGWLVILPDSVSIPRFEEHNGSSAKRRAQEAFRMAGKRESVRNTFAKDANKNATRGRGEEEKIERREQERKSGEVGAIDRSLCIEDRGEIERRAGKIVRALRVAKPVDLAFAWRVAVLWHGRHLADDDVAQALESLEAKAAAGERISNRAAWFRRCLANRLESLEELLKSCPVPRDWIDRHKAT